jgi:hypothetical protein
MHDNFGPYFVSLNVSENTSVRNGTEMILAVHRMYRIFNEVLENEIWGGGVTIEKLKLLLWSEPATKGTRGGTALEFQNTTQIHSKC